MSGDTRDTIGYHPGLDGLRGLALLAIVVYHSGIGWAPGAFLSVSTFFTLSGFLITAVMLTEHERVGRVSLQGFWDRRLRRLLPASLAAIAAIVVAAAFLADSTQLARLRGDALASLFYVANWRFIAVGDTYGANFASPSPFTHFWTLAIEEQFYLVFPVLLVVLLAASRGSRRIVGGVLGGLVVLFVAWGLVLAERGASVDRLYFGTDVRLPELLLGALFAWWYVGHPAPTSDRARQVLRVAGPAAVVAMGLLWATASLRDPIFYRGGLPAYALLTVTVIFAVLQPDGLLVRVLGWRPLVWVGLVSYGAYLVHFPLLLWLDQRTDLPAGARLAIALPVTLVIAAVSARWLERPVRDRRAVAGPRAWWTPPAAVATVLLVVLSATALARPDAAPIDFVAAAEQFNDQPAADQAITGDAVDLSAVRDLLPAVRASRAPRVATFGDSTALMMGLGLDGYSDANLDVVVSRGGWAKLGCGLLLGVTRRAQGNEVTAPPECDTYLASWSEHSARRPADVAVVIVGPWDVLDVRRTDGGPWEAIGEDPALDAALRGALDRAVEALLVDNGMVVLVSPPDIAPGRIDGRAKNGTFPEADPARMERFRELLAEVASDHDGAAVVDLAGWLAARPDEPELRPDGIHFTDDSALEAARWLAPELIRLHTARTGSTETLVVPPPSLGSSHATTP